MDVTIDEQMAARIAEMQAEDQKSVIEFRTNETALERISNADLPLPIELVTDAEILWNDQQRDSGSLSFQWSGRDILPC